MQEMLEATCKIRVPALAPVNYRFANRLNAAGMHAALAQLLNKTSFAYVAEAAGDKSAAIFAVILTAELVSLRASHTSKT